MGDIYLCRTANMSWRTCVIVKQMQSNQSMSCLQAIEGEDTETPFICHIMNLLWVLSDKGTWVRFSWVPSHCGIEGNEIVDQLAKENRDHDIDALIIILYADLKHVVNYISNRRFKSSGMCLYMVEISIFWKQHSGHPRNSITWRT